MTDWVPVSVPVMPMYSWQNVRHVYNTTKNRYELWHKCQYGDQWVLRSACPAREWNESFLASWDVLAAFWNLVIADLNWAVQANPAADLANFADLNELGGGLQMITAGTSGNWCSINWSGTYPTSIAKSPHLKFTVAPARITNLQIIAGLVGATNKPADASGAFPANFPYDGIYVLKDTSAADPLKFVTKKAGVATETVLSYTPDTVHKSYTMRVNDDCDKVEFIRKGVLLATHTTNLPTCQLQPYFEIQTLENNTFTFHLHDFRLIMDRGF